jgi:hypothetical protein
VNIHSVSAGPAEDVEAIGAAIDPDVALWDAMELAMHHFASDGSTMLIGRPKRSPLRSRPPP